MTEWAGQAWQELSSAKYDNLRKSCWTKTGCLITADGSEDMLIKPGSLPDYEVLAPSSCDPVMQVHIQTSIMSTVEDNDQFRLVYGEGEEGNIFEIMNAFFI